MSGGSLIGRTDDTAGRRRYHLWLRYLSNTESCLDLMGRMVYINHTPG